MADSKRNKATKSIVSSPAGSAVSRPNFSRDDLRSRFLNNFASDSIVLPFRGMFIEIRDPSIEQMLSNSDMLNGSSSADRTANMIVQYCYVPDTDTPIFETSDVPMIKQWKFNAEYLAIQNAIFERAGFDTAQAEEVVQDNPLSE